MNDVNDIDNGHNALNNCDTPTLKSLLQDYNDSDYIPFHMPGHKRGGFDHLLGVDSIDITEIEGFDNLHNATGILREAQDRASKTFKVAHTRFLINGSTAGILAGIRSVCNNGDSILIARNCHKSVYNAIELLELDAHYIMPIYHEQGFFGEINVKDVESALASIQDAKALVITSPTYEGIISDIASIAEICHRNNVTLIVDEAHGAHLSFANFEKSARELGADIIVNSIHKTLPSLTQTALLHVNSERVDISRVDYNLAIFQSSSPSYVLMSSIDGAVSYLDKVGIDEWCQTVDELRERLSSLENIRLVGKDEFKVYGYDKSKIVLDVSGCDISGVALAKALRDEYHIEVEMSSINHVVLMTGAGDKIYMYDRIVSALKAIDSEVKNIKKARVIKCAELPKQAFNSHKMHELNVEYVNINDSENRIIADTIIAYPPGSPLIVKGERLNKNTIAYILDALKMEVNLISIKGIEGDEVLVVKD